MKLLHIKQSTKPDKKMMATFQGETGRTKTIHFGARGMSDYTLSKDDARKELYLSRHRAREDWNKPDSAGALSRWILWNKPTISASIADYKSRFNF